MTTVLISAIYGTLMLVNNFSDANFFFVLVGKAFEPIYVFDYSHGKKKSTDYLSSMLKPEIMTSLPPLKPEISAADEIPWEGAGK